MKLMFLLILATVVAVRADCDACIDGWCHARETLIEGFLITDKMAIDQKDDILYVQLDHNLNTAYHLRENTIRLVQKLNTTGMTVHQDTQVLYTSYNHTIFKIAPGDNTPKTFYMKDTVKPYLLEYGDRLYFVEKNVTHLCYIENEEAYYYDNDSGDISDLVALTNSDVYFVAYNVVYFYKKRSYMDYRDFTALKTLKNAKLSKDKSDNVYVTDASANVIYKMNETGNMDEYAAYETGSVGQIVFETRCTFIMQSKYIIKKL